MKKCIVVSLVLWLTSIFMFPSFCRAQEASPYSISMDFSAKVGAPYMFLMLGQEEGKVAFEWADGTQEEFPIKKEATPFRGEIKTKHLTIKGNILVLECSGNGLTSLDISNMPILTDLTSRGNFIPTIDFSKSKSLKKVVIQDSPLQKLDLSACTLIDSVVVANNRIAEIAFPANSPLKTLVCMTNPGLKKLDLSGCPKLKYLNALQTLVTEYDLTSNKELTYFSAGLGRPITKLLLPPKNNIDTLLLPLAGLQKLDLSETKKLKVLTTDNNFLLSKLDLSSQKDLRVLSCEANSITELNLSNSPQLTSLTCNNNQIKNLDVSNHIYLEELLCHSNQLEQLNITGCNALVTLDCSENPELKSIALPSSLKSINCSNCGLSQIDLSQLPSLDDLHCDQNSLSALDVSKNPLLVTLSCSENAIPQLDLKEMQHLQDLSVNGNPIKEGLTLLSATNLRFVSVNNTQLDACALDQLYQSLRVKREGDDDNDLGGLILMNQVEAAATSHTELAVKKGWMVSIVGDGSGCKTSVDALPSYQGIRIEHHAEGWRLLQIPEQVKTITLVDTAGQCIAQYQPTESSLFIPAPGRGIFLIIIDGRRGFTCYAQ